MEIRTTKPEKGNKYYIRQRDGGYNPCKLGNPTDKDCNVLSNCVGYAVGRFNEESNEGCCKYFASMNAENFYDNAYKWGLQVGQEPRQGAIMCWAKGKKANASDGCGHVAIIEKVNNDGTLLTSESAYNGKAFYTKTRNNNNGRWGMNSNYTFVGYIYNPNLIEIVEPVERDETKNQLKILKSTLRVRQEPNLSGLCLGYATKDAIYDDLVVLEESGYKWHKIAENNYVAEVEGYVELLPKVEPIQPSEPKEDKNIIIKIVNIIFDFILNLLKKK